MFQIELLAAGCGDCIWIEYGDPGAPHIVLIDGGVGETKDEIADRVRRAAEQRHVSKLQIDLLVVTHIDTDHIGGILPLLEEGSIGVGFDDIWFNGDRQLSNLLGPAEGDRFSKLLYEQRHRLPWNAKFGGAAIGPSPQGDLPEKEFHGLRLTVLGPTPKRLKNLAERWQEVMGEFEKLPLPVSAERPDLMGRRDEWPPQWRESRATDHSPANGSSIALLAEYESKAVLLAGDAFASDVENSLKRLQKQRHQGDQPIELAAFKVSHHGSASNLSQRLVEQVSCQNYLISTDGSTHMHPDHLALLRILKYSRERPNLVFNYESETTRDWGERKADLPPQFPDFDTTYPSAGGGIAISL
jgi:glyoxylase-like metal-dependent hydrolase (beta-lactamase superfamily II)